MNRGLLRVVNYGPLPTNLEDIEKFSAQVLGIFGTRDRSISLAKVRAFESCMNTLRKAVDIEIYDGPGIRLRIPRAKTLTDPRQCQTANRAEEKKTREDLRKVAPPRNART